MNLLSILKLVKKLDYDALDADNEVFRREAKLLCRKIADLNMANTTIHQANLGLNYELFKYKMIGIPLAIVAGIGIGWWI